MLTLSRATYDGIVAHAKRDHPDEACGIVAGPEGSDRPERPRDFATLLTHGDLVRLVVAALEAPDSVRFGTFYGVSANTWRFWEIDDACEAIGYEPADDAEQFR